MSKTKRMPARPVRPMAAAAFAIAMGVAIPSMAQTVDCSTFSNRVYVDGSSAVKPFLAAIAKTFAAANPPVTIIYKSEGSCVGVNYMTTAPAGTITGTGSVWDASGTENTCNLTAVTGDVLDIGVSDVFASTCGITPASGVKDFLGPIQTMAFAVPQTSTQYTISAEAAYMVFGFGADTAAHTISPWTDPTLYQVRSASSGTQQMISAALAQVGSGFTAAKVKGTSNSGSGNVLTGLQTAATANNQEKAIGFLAMDVIDSNRSSVRPLSFQFVGQTCGYTPDSQDNAFDKQNVRDGHYAIWGNLHMLTSVGSDGRATNANAQKVLDLLTGMPTDALLSTEVTKGVVPDCAMRVSRTGEVGPMASYMPAHSCECAYLVKALPTAPASCRKCTTTAADCPACNLGYCEVQ